MRSRFSALPRGEPLLDGGGHQCARFLACYGSSQVLVVTRMAVPDVSAHCQFNRVRVKLLRRRRTPNATRVFLARVFCNRSLLFGRTRRKQFSYPPRKRVHVCRIKLLTSFGRTLPSTLPGLRIGQAFLFRPRQGVFLDQHTLSFVPLSGPTETDDDGTERRISARAPSKRSVAPRKEHQVIEISACQTEGPFLFHAEKATLAKLSMTFGAGRVPNEPENNDLAAFRQLADPSVHVFGYGPYIHGSD